jgi:hypothetical protein
MSINRFHKFYKIQLIGQKKIRLFHYSLEALNNAIVSSFI